MASGNWPITAHRRVNESTNRINLLPISITVGCWNSRTIIQVILILFFSKFSSVLRWNKSDLVKLINPRVIWANPSQLVPQEEEKYQEGKPQRGDFKCHSGVGTLIVGFFRGRVWNGMEGVQLGGTSQHEMKVSGSHYWVLLQIKKQLSNWAETVCQS